MAGGAEISCRGCDEAGGVYGAREPVLEEQPVTRTDAAARDSASGRTRHRVTLCVIVLPAAEGCLTFSGLAGPPLLPRGAKYASLCRRNAILQMPKDIAQKGSCQSLLIFVG